MQMDVSRKGLVLGGCLVLLMGAVGRIGFAAGGPKLEIDQPAPEILATTTDGQSVTLDSLKGKPVVLEFGSITEPVFRLRMPGVEKLAGKYGDKVNFVIVYQRESHPADTDQALEINSPDFAIARPVSADERTALAVQAAKRLEIKNEKLLVDAWNDTSTLRYGGYANMTFVIDDKGNLQAAYPWMDVNKVKSAVDLLLAGKTLTADLRGSVEPAKAGTLDYAGSAMDMTGLKGPQAIGMVVDKLHMTDDQKAVIYPALAQFLADAKDFREKQGLAVNKVGAAGGGAAPTTQAAPTFEETQAGIQKLRTSANALKDACRRVLSEQDAKTIIDTLDQGPAHRLFVNN
jgi:thiol-disulfide isomerase/thioredoxin